MIDLHTHLIPSLDDGSNSLSESIETLKIHQSQGYEKVICTPHISRFYPNSIQEILEKYLQFKEEIDKLPLEITLSCGAEYNFDMLVEKIANDEEIIHLGYPDTNGKPRYILVEFPHNVKPVWLGDIKKFIKEDMILIFAHPERYDNFAVINDIFRECDCLFALNSSSVLGHEGDSVKKNAFRYITHFSSRVLFVSDTHPALKRYPQFGRIFPYLENKYSHMITDYWFRIIPQAIMDGKKIDQYENKLISVYIRASIN